MDYSVNCENCIVLVLSPLKKFDPLLREEWILAKLSSIFFTAVIRSVNESNGRRLTVESFVERIL